MQILSEDYSKAAFLCADRTVHLHARYGAHYATRIPRAGRDLAFAPEAADLLIVGSSPDIYRHGCHLYLFVIPSLGSAAVLHSPTSVPNSRLPGILSHAPARRRGVCA